MYHLIALLIGFFIDLLLGDPHSIPHPVVWIGKLISAAEKLVRRLLPKTVRGENIAGGVLWVIVVLVSTAVPALLLYAAYRLHPAAEQLQDLLINLVQLVSQFIQVQGFHCFFSFLP